MSCSPDICPGTSNSRSDHTGWSRVSKWWTDTGCSRNPNCRPWSDRSWARKVETLYLERENDVLVNHAYFKMSGFIFLLNLLLFMEHFPFIYVLSVNTLESLNLHREQNLLTFQLVHFGEYPGQQDWDFPGFTGQRKFVWEYLKSIQNISWLITLISKKKKIFIWNHCKKLNHSLLQDNVVIEFFDPAVNRIQTFQTFIRTC